MSDSISRVVAITAVVVLFATGMALAEQPVPYKLENGLTVILCPVPAAQDVAVVVLLNLGADRDPAGKSGRAHLLEHLYCTAAAGDAPIQDFAAIQKRYGAGYNEQTGFDFTVLAGVVKPEQLAEELKDAAARMSDLHITDADLKREVPRVLLELGNMYGGIPALAGINHVRTLLHPAPQGGRYGGSAEHVQAITLSELQQSWSDYYKPKNAVLVLAGRFDAAAARKLIEQHFAPISAGKALPAAPPTPEVKAGATHRISVKPVMQDAPGVVCVGYAAPPPGSRDYAPFLLAVSRLWALSQGGFQPGQPQPVFYPPLDDPTTIALQAPLPPGTDAEPILAQLDQCLRSALAPKIEPKDRLLAVNSMMMPLGTGDVPDAMWVQNTYGLAFAAGRQYQMKMDGKKLRDAIERVTAADVQRLSKAVFAPTQRIAVIVEVAK